MKTSRFTGTTKSHDRLLDKNKTQPVITRISRAYRIVVGKSGLFVT